MNKADLEAEIGEHFPDMPDALVAAPSLAALSNEEFKHHLPAFMCAVLRAMPAVASADVVLALKLPVELNANVVATSLRLHEATNPEAGPDPNALLQKQFAQTNAAIHRFIARASLFNHAQGRTIYHFLAYLRDQHDSSSPNHEPALAIGRYWFQFA